MTQAPATKRFTVSDYYAMCSIGIIAPDDRVELIRGEVVEMPPVTPEHSGVVNRLNRLLSRATGDRALVSVPGPVRLDPFSEPLPDLALLKPRPDDYTSSHPGPQDVLLLIEVSLSSLDYDRTTKLNLYAAAGIPEVWLVDLQHGIIEGFAEPDAGGFRAHVTATRGEVVAPRSLPGLEVRVAEVLG